MSERSSAWVAFWTKFVGELAGSIAFGLLVVGSIASAKAATYYWTGGANDGDWATGGNWASGSAPTSGTSNCVTFPASRDYDPAPDNSISSLTLNKIVFASNLSSLTFSGNGIVFAGSAPAILQDCGNDITISNDLSWSANGLTLSVPSGGELILSGTLSGPQTGSSGGNLTLAAGSVSLVGSVNTGIGKIVIGSGGTGTLDLIYPSVVSSGIVLGDSGGAGTLSCSGGSLSVSCSLEAAGAGRLVLNGVSAQFAGLQRTGASVLTVLPQAGNLNSNERVGFTNAVGTTNGIVGPWVVRQTSNSSTVGEYITVTHTGSDPYYLANASYQSTFGTGNVVSVSSVTSLTDDTTAYALKQGAVETSVASGKTLTLSSGGLILNGGTLSGGKVSFGGPALIYAGGGMGTISSQVATDSGLRKFGPQTLVLSGNNSNLKGSMLVDAGVLRIENSGAGATGSGNDVRVVDGAALEINGDVHVGDKILTLRGSGPDGNGSLRNVQGNNSWAGAVILATPAKIDSGDGSNSLALSNTLIGSNDLTKTGTGTLILAGDNVASAFAGAICIEEGTLSVQHGNALGLTSGGGATTVVSEATLSFQGGITTLAEPLTIGGNGVGSGGALRNIEDENTFAGPVTLTANTKIGADAGWLTLTGTIRGSYGLTKVGSGGVVLTNTGSSFTGLVSVEEGVLSVPVLNKPGTLGPLGTGAAAVTLGSSGHTGAVLYTGVGATSSRTFTLAASGTGEFRVPYGVGLTLTGEISGSGELRKADWGDLNLKAANSYTGNTTVQEGSLVLSGVSGAIASSTVVVNQSTVLTLSNAAGANSTSRIDNSASISLNGGTLNFNNDASAADFAETVGMLNISGAGSIAAQQAASTHTSALTFASLSRSTGGTLDFSGTGLGATDNRNDILFSTPPTPTGGIIGGWATVGSDFAAYDTSHGVKANAATVENVAGASNDANVKKTSGETITANKTINSLITGGSDIILAGGSSLTLASGGLIASAGGKLSGGTLKGSADSGSVGGELVVHALQDFTIGSVISNNGTAGTKLVKTGPGKLTLTGDNTFTGDTYINQGVLEYAPSISATCRGTLHGPGSLLKTGANTLNVQGQSDVDFTVSQGQVASQTGWTLNGNLEISNSGSWSGSGTVHGSLNYTSGMDSSFSPVIDGSESTVTLDAPVGTKLTLNSANQHGGGTIITAGTLQAGDDDALGTGPLSMGSRGKFDLHDHDVSVTSLDGLAGAIITDESSGTSTLTVDIEGSSNFGGTITHNATATLSLVKSGGGKLTLAGTNHYQGGTTVSEGVLEITSLTGLPLGQAVTIESGGCLVIASGLNAAGSASAASVSTAVPEPGTLVLLAIGLLSGLTWRAGRATGLSRES